MKLVAFALLSTAFSAHASHPLLTEDTGVLGRGMHELELHGERSRAAGVRAAEAVAKLGYGLAETLDVEVELPYVRTTAGGSVTRGRGDAGLGAKWRFFEKDAFSMALKSELLLPTGRDELGLGAGRARWGVKLAAAYELGRFELLAHLGYLHNRNTLGERRSLAHQSVAVRFGATERLRLVIDLARDTNTDPQTRAHAREAMLGATYAASDAVGLGLGFRKALNDAADERGVRAGIKLRW
jgi:hypothetical protein